MRRTYGGAGLQYVPDWLEFDSAVVRTAERQQRAAEIGVIADELVYAIRDGKVRTRWDTAALDEFIAVGEWHWRSGGATARISQVLVLRADLEKWWQALETKTVDTDAARPLQRKRSAPRREKVESAMRAGIVSGAITRERLRAMLEKELASQYSASRDTCRKARNSVLAITESIDSIPTNDK
jgi:hypothetical protein